jgi:hypothetical protein
MQYIFEFLLSLGCGFQTFWADFFRLNKMFSLLGFYRENQRWQLHLTAEQLRFKAGRIKKKPAI